MTSIYNSQVSYFKPWNNCAGKVRALGLFGHALPIGLCGVVVDYVILVAHFTRLAQGIAVPISRGRPPRFIG